MFRTKYPNRCHCPPFFSLCIWWYMIYEIWYGMIEFHITFMAWFHLLPGQFNAQVLKHRRGSPRPWPDWGFESLKIKGPDNPTSQLLPLETGVEAVRRRKKRQRTWWRFDKFEKLCVKELVVCVRGRVVCEKVVCQKVVCERVACDKVMCEGASSTLGQIRPPKRHGWEHGGTFGNHNDPNGPARPATQKACGCRQVPRLPRKVPRRLATTADQAHHQTLKAEVVWPESPLSWPRSHHARQFSKGARDRVFACDPAVTFGTNPSHG